MQWKAAQPEQGGAPRWGRRIAWLVTIWLLSVGVLALVAFALKAVMRLAGFSA